MDRCARGCDVHDDGDHDEHVGMTFQLKVSEGLSMVWRKPLTSHMFRRESDVRISRPLDTDLDFLRLILYCLGKGAW